MQVGVRNRHCQTCTGRASTYCTSAFRSVVCVHPARHQNSPAGDQAAEHLWCLFLGGTATCL